MAQRNVSEHSGSPSDEACDAESRVLRAFLVHAVTASGVIVGFLGLKAVFDDGPRSAILLLIAAQLLDGIDGPMARAWQISKLYPRLDGYLLDLVVDYVTCVVVPVAFMYHFDLLPSGLAVTLCAGILFTSALWFSRTDMMTDDHWFRGFPATWNLVAPTFFLLQTGTTLNAVVVVVLSLVQLTDLPFAHPVQVEAHRRANLTVTIAWIVAMATAAFVWPETPIVLRVALLAAPAWSVFTTIDKAFSQRDERLALLPVSTTPDD